MMKKTAIFALAGMLMSFPVYAGTMKVSSNWVSMREAADTEAKLVRVLYKEHKVKTVDGTETEVNGDKWVQVEDKDGTRGWIRSARLEAVSETAEAAKSTEEPIENVAISAMNKAEAAVTAQTETQKEEPKQEAPALEVSKQETSANQPKRLVLKQTPNETGAAANEAKKQEEKEAADKAIIEHVVKSLMPVKEKEKSVAEPAKTANAVEDEVITRNEEFKKAVAANKKDNSKAKVEDSEPTAKINKPTSVSNMVFVEGEGLHSVKIALKDLNRITCASKIGDPIYSKDKQIEIVRGGEKDLFVKISPIQTTYNGKTETTFNTFPREVFIECSGRVYNLVLLPEDELPTQTIAFRSAINDVKQAKEFERASPYEIMISDLIKSAYIEQVPSGFSVENGSLAYQFKEMDMRLRYVYRGYDYIVEDWELTSKMDGVVEIEENIFVPILKNPRAITLTVPRLARGETSRLLAVRAADGTVGR